MTAVLSNPFEYNKEIDSCLNILSERYGEIDYQSKWFPFDITDYYENEMGTGLMRCFISFKPLYSPKHLADFKIYTNNVEQSFSQKGDRCVNLDCGYMDYFKLVLASVKYGGQKIYLDKGIYADMILYYQKGVFEPFFWTFPDFKDLRYNNILCEIRTKYKKQMKS